MEQIRVTIVGQDISKEVVTIFDDLGLNMVNHVKTGMLGNLKTLTYTFDFPEDEVIERRRELMDRLAEYPTRLMPMYVHGDWMRVFVFKAMRL
jgi:hypothetical protein